MRSLHFIASLIWALMVASQSWGSELCQPVELVKALQAVGQVKWLHNCRVEVSQADMLIHGSWMPLTAIFVEDKRLQQVAGLDIWAEHPCEYRYDNYKNTHYYYDERVVGRGQSKKRFIKLELNKAGQISALELGIQDPKSWTWESRVYCRAQHYEEGL